jgi:hypothetical protein
LLTFALLQSSWGQFDARNGMLLSLSLSLLGLLSYSPIVGNFVTWSGSWHW